MPDVSVRLPHKAFQGVRWYRRKAARSNFMFNLASDVAEHLSCEDYDGNDAPLTAADDITVHLMPYKPSDIFNHGAPVMVEIIAYDYPSRMVDINSRVKAIAAHATSLLKIHAHYAPPKDQVVSVCFIPISDGCWV